MSTKNRMLYYLLCLWSQQIIYEEIHWNCQKPLIWQTLLGQDIILYMNKRKLLLFQLCKLSSDTTTHQRLRGKSSTTNILFLLEVLASEVFKTLEHDKLCLCSWLASITVVTKLMVTTPMGVTYRTTLKCYSVRRVKNHCSRTW